MKPWRMLLVVTVCGIGCAIFNGGGDPQLTEGQAPTLDSSQLDSLKLETVRQVFPPGEAVTLETLGHRRNAQDPLQDGRYAFTPKASIAVRVYGGEHGGKAGLTALMQDSATSYELVEPTLTLPLTWWYQVGPPATVLFEYGNTLTTIQMGILEPDAVRTKGAAAVRAVASRILRCSRGLEAED